jgi:hypothetical protein
MEGSADNMGLSLSVKKALTGGLAPQHRKTRLPALCARNAPESPEKIFYMGPPGKKPAAKKGGSQDPYRPHTPPLPHCALFIVPG